jgi:glycosyltransferase involved in cell wall biosynthesis
MQRKEPYLSIISPCYNVEEYVAQTISSVLSQSYQDWEYILVDDGATDKTPQILKEFASKDSRIRVIHKTNGGVSSARNVGIEAAKGEWIIFLDSDDWLADEALEEYVKCSKNIAADVYHINSYTNKGKVEKKRPPLQDIVRDEESKKWFVYDTLYPYIDKFFNKVDVGRIRGVNGKMYRRALLTNNHIRFDETLKIAEDALFNYYAFCAASRIAMVNKYLLHYRINSVSVMHKYNPSIVDVNNNIMKIFYREIKMQLSVDKIMRICYTGMAMECIFRAMKLKYLNPQNTNSFWKRKQEYNDYLKSNLIQAALSDENLNYMQIGKKQIMWCINRGMIISSMLLGKVAIAYLSRKSEI